MKIKTIINDSFYSSYRHVNMPLLNLNLLSIFNIWDLFFGVKDLDTKIKKKKTTIYHYILQKSLRITLKLLNCETYNNINN